MKAELVHVDRQTNGRTETDRHDEINSRVSQFCERASKLTFLTECALFICSV